jgi:hypothetical protein
MVMLFPTLLALPSLLLTLSLITSNSPLSNTLSIWSTALSSSRLSLLTLLFFLPVWRGRRRKTLIFLIAVLSPETFRVGLGRSFVGLYIVGLSAPRRLLTEDDEDESHNDEYGFHWVCEYN